MRVDEALKYISEAGMNPQFFCRLHEKGYLKTYIRSYLKNYHSDPKPEAPKVNPLFNEMTTPLTRLKSLSDSELSQLVDKLEKIATYNQLREILIVIKKELDEANEASQKYKEENEILKKNQLDPDQITKLEERDKYEKRLKAYEVFLGYCSSFLSVFAKYCESVISLQDTERTELCSYIKITSPIMINTVICPFLLIVFIFSIFLSLPRLYHPL